MSCTRASPWTLKNMSGICMRIIHQTDRKNPLKANNCIRSPVEKFVWIHFICIYNFLIQIWSRNENWMPWSFASLPLGALFVINYHTAEFYSFCLVSLLCMPQYKRALIKTCLYTIYEIILCKFDFYCLSILPFSLFFHNSLVNKTSFVLLGNNRETQK